MTEDDQERTKLTSAVRMSFHRNIIMAVNFSTFRHSSHYFSMKIAAPSLNRASFAAILPQWVQIGTALEVLAVASLIW